MPSKVVQLGPVTFSSGATIVGVNGLMDDASNILVYANTATTSPVQIQVEPTDTGASWVGLTAGQITSSGSNQVLVAASSQGYVLNNIAWTQMRFISTAVVNSGTSITICKQVSVGIVLSLGIITATIPYLI